MSRRFLVCLFLAFAGVAGSAPWATAQQHTRLPSQRTSSLQALDAVPVERLPAVDAEALRAEDEEQRGDVGPYRYGTVVETDVTPSRTGAWERLSSGDWLWRVRIQSGDARSLSLGFAPFVLPTGARLFVHDGAGSTVRGPYTNADATNGEHWTPLVRGEQIVVELVVPSGRRSAVNLTVSEVVHGYRAIHPSERGGDLSKSGTCNVDVACEKADPWRKQVRSVGLYSFEANSGAFVCTGSLMNNTAEDGRPFFLTAEHCISSPSTASTMVFYWNYQNKTCRTPGTPENGQVTSDDKLAQTSSGAVLRARYGSFHEDGGIAGKSDLALVEVDDTIPPRYNLFFSGWSRRGATTDSSVTIHHPAGHGKRISFDRNPSSLIDYPTSGFCPDLQAPDGDTHLEIQNWEVGTTEGGSSGAPLYNTNQRVVGVLSGGCAGCGGDGDADDNDAPDWYGRIAPGFSNGDYTPDGFQSPATLADWLDPTDSGTLVLDGRAQGEVPRPDPPTRLSGTTAPDSVTLTWQPSDSSDVTQYRVYRDTAAIDSTTGPPERAVYDSLSAGQTRYVDTSVVADTRYHYRLTAVNGDGVESAPSDPARVFLYPTQVQATVDRSFNSGTDSAGYRLVALPGKIDRPLSEAIAGEAGTDWQAYWDDGSDTDFWVRFNGSDTFTFRPGTGFWLTATQPWSTTVEGPTVPLRGDSAATIGLRDGWNVVSNPTGRDVAWHRVEAATPGALQALWAFDGAFVETDTFRSARDGVAYYFYNDASTRDSLVIPYPGALGGKTAPSAPASEPSLLALTAQSAPPDGSGESTVRVGIEENAKPGLGTGDLVAPPGRFETTNLRIETPGGGASTRTRFLMAERRPLARSGGQTFSLRLRSPANGPITLTARHLDALAEREVALLHPAISASYDLREQSTVTIRPRKSKTPLKVAIGTESYVENEVENVLPDDVRLTAYPNPVRTQGATIEYTLPEQETVTLRVYDVLGREVATLVRGPKEPRLHTVRLATDRLSSGVYFARLRAGTQVATQKITVVR